MRRKEAQAAHLNPTVGGPEDPAPIARSARIVSISEDGAVMVALAGDKRALNARLAIPASHERIEHAIQNRQEVLVLLESGSADRPVIIGFIEDKASPAKPSPAQVIEADVDGKRVRVVAQDEVVLECGSASITLRRNGRVIIKGTYVETHSDGTNRIKGGQVRIN
jgi:hypothetical protein